MLAGKSRDDQCPLFADVEKRYGRTRIDCAWQRTVPSFRLDLFNLDTTQFEHVLVLSERRILLAERLRLGLRERLVGRRDRPLESRAQRRFQDPLADPRAGRALGDQLGELVERRAQLKPSS